MRPLSNMAGIRIIQPRRLTAGLEPDRGRPDNDGLIVILKQSQALVEGSIRRRGIELVQVQVPVHTLLFVGHVANTFWKGFVLRRPVHQPVRRLAIRSAVRRVAHIVIAHERLSHRFAHGAGRPVPTI